MLILLAGDRAQRLPLRGRPQEPVPAAGHRPARRAGCSADQSISYQGHGRETAPGGEHRSRRPRGGYGGRLHRRRARRRRLHVRDAQAGSERSVKGLAVIARLRPKLARVAGVQLFLSPVQDFRSGGRQSNATYQYTLEGESSATLREWAGKLLAALKTHPELDRRRQRRAGQRRADQRPRRPRRRRPARHQRHGRRHRAVRRLRPAPGRGHLHRPEPVPRGDGMGAAVHAEPRSRLATSTCRGRQLVSNGGQLVAIESTGSDAQGTSSRGRRRRRRHRWRLCRSAPNPALRNASGGNVLSNTPDSMVPLKVIARFIEGRDRDLGQPPGHRAGDDDLVQPRRGRDRWRRPQRHHRSRGRHRHADHGARRVRRHGAAGAADR